MIDQDLLKQIVRLALLEDIRSGDITSQILIEDKQKAQGKIIVKENCVLCGLQAARWAFKLLNEKIIFKSKYQDGKKIRRGTTIAKIIGSAKDILSAERTALNFLGHLSGIATFTNKFLQKLKAYKVKIRDTRKTLPGLRMLEKYAVRCGGGKNHRFSLDDGILIKDNHLALIPQISKKKEIISQKKKNLFLEIEVKNINEIDEALKINPDLIMLDNMNPNQLEKTVKIITNKRKKVIIEASGNINLKNISDYAKSGVNFLSLGCITHSAPYVDFSLELKPL